MISWMELADYAVAGLTLLIGIGVGRRMGPKPPEPLKPICSCSHGYGEHLEGAQCQGDQKRPRYNKVGDWTGHEYVPCKCTRYDGPDPAIFGLDAR